MALKQNTAEGGTNGVIPTTANTGGSSGDAFGQITTVGVPTYTFANNVASHGTLSYRVVGIAADTAKFYLYNTGSSSGALRIYIYFNVLPSASQSLLAFQNTTFTQVASVGINSSNKLIVQDSAATLYTAANAVVANTWYRLELQASSGTTTTDGVVNFQYYVGDGTTVQGSSASTTANTGTTNLIRGYFGKLNSTPTLDANFDSFGYDDTTITPLGPYSTANQPPTANAGLDQSNIEPYTTISLVGTDSDTDGTVVTRTWRQISGTTVTLSGTGANRTYTAPGTLAGTTLVFGYKVTDDGGADSVEDTVSHVVLFASERAVVGGVEVPVATKVVSGGQLI